MDAQVTGMPQRLSVPVAAECARPMVTCAAVPPRSPAQRSRPQHSYGRLPQPASPTLLSCGPMDSGGAIDFGPLLVASASAAMSRRGRLLYLSVGAFCEAGWSMNGNGSVLCSSVSTGNYY